MANERIRRFELNENNKERLSDANLMPGSFSRLGTEFSLTGMFTVSYGWTDSRGNLRNSDRLYAYFEGTRNSKEVPAGINAGVFLHHPFGGFTEEEERQLTDFSRKLLECFSAADFYQLCEEEGVFSGKTIIVSDIIRHLDLIPERSIEKVRNYPVFDLKEKNGV